jgi:hypothetical protein
MRGAKKDLCECCEMAFKVFKKRKEAIHWETFAKEGRNLTDSQGRSESRQRGHQGLEAQHTE